MSTHFRLPCAMLLWCAATGAYAIEPVTLDEPATEPVQEPPAYDQAALDQAASIPTATEQRDAVLRRADASLESLDILLRPEEPAERQHTGGGGGDGGADGEGGDGGLYGDEEELYTEETVPLETFEIDTGEIDSPIEDGEQQTAANPAPGDETKEANTGTFEDDDLVTKQICELARQEPDPEVRKNLETKCQQLRGS